MNMIVLAFVILALVAFLCAAFGLNQAGPAHMLPLGLGFAAAAWLSMLLVK